MNVLEANTCKTPAVCFNVPGIQDSIKHDETGTLVEEPGNKKFAREVQKLIENPDLRKSYSRNTGNWSEKHFWFNSVKKLEKTLCEISEK